jgi:pimeloyl-ACP methyl ester carboxylesterase
MTCPSPVGPRGFAQLSIPSIAVAVAVLLTLLGIPASAADAQDTPADWTSGPCVFKGSKQMTAGNVECSYLHVPLRHAAPDGAKIKLAVIILRFHGADKHPHPVLYAQGGPGGSTLETYVSVLLAAKAAGQYKRDLVLWDQRGTLHSEPNLLCPEVTDVQIRDAVEFSRA